MMNNNAINNNVVSLADYTTLLHLKYIKRAAFFKHPTLLPGQHISSVTLASLDLVVPESNERTTLNITAIDYMLIRSCYGFNTMAFCLWGDRINTLDRDLQTNLLTEINDALTVCDFRQFYIGLALQQVCEILKATPEQIAQTTGLDFNEITSALRGHSELSESSFLTLLSLYRLYACTLNSSKRKIAAPLISDASWLWLDHMLTSCSEAISLPKHITYDEALNAYQLFIGNRSIEVSSTNLFLFCIGAIDKLPKNLQSEATIAYLRIIAAHHYSSTARHSDSNVQIARKVKDSLNPTAYERDIPSLPTGGLILEILGQEIFATTVDLFDVAAGLTIPMNIIESGINIDESTYQELELVALHYFLRESLLRSTWMEVIKAFKISQFDLYQIPPAMVEICTSREFADTKTPNWLFLVLPNIAAELAGEPK